MARYDIVSPRPRKDGKTYWHKVGAAFPRDKGGFSIILDSLPLPDAEGRVSLLMSEAQEDQHSKPPRAADPDRQAPPARRELDDEIPF